MSVAPVGLLAAVSPVAQATVPVAAQPATQDSFASLISNGLEGVNQKVLAADRMVRAFALDDSIPVHQVTYALEQARLSLELAVQVRTRLLDGFQQLMNMQL